MRDALKNRQAAEMPDSQAHCCCKTFLQMAKTADRTIRWTGYSPSSLVKTVYRQSTHNYVLQAPGISSLVQNSRQRMMADRRVCTGKKWHDFSLLEISTTNCTPGVQGEWSVTSVAQILEGLEALALGLCSREVQLTPVLWVYWWSSMCVCVFV